MKSRSVAIAAAIALCLPGVLRAAESGARHADHGGAANVAVSDSVFVPEGEVHDSDIVTISGDVRIEGKVSGDVVVINGTLELEGTVDGEVVLVLSDGRIGDEAEIGGNLVNVGGEVDRSPEARIGGELVDINLSQLTGPISKGFSTLARGFYVLVLIKLFLLFLTLVLLTALVPRRVLVIASAFPRRWGAAILAGVVAYCAAFVVFLVLVLLIIVLIGIPLIPAFGVVLYVVINMGLAGMLYLVGHRAGKNLFKRDLEPFPAVLGGFLVYAVLSLIPGFSYLFFFVISPIVSSLALGIALITRFGSAEDGWRRTAPAGPAGGMYPPPPLPPPVVPGA